METKHFKEDILNHQESFGFPRLNVATETRTKLTFYGRRVEDSSDATRLTSNQTSETVRLLWSDNTQYAYLKAKKSEK